MKLLTWWAFNGNVILYRWELLLMQCLYKVNIKLQIQHWFLSFCYLQEFSVSPEGLSLVSPTSALWQFTEKYSKTTNILLHCLNMAPKNLSVETKGRLPNSSKRNIRDRPVKWNLNEKNCIFLKMIVTAGFYFKRKGYLSI